MNDLGIQMNSKSNTHTDLVVGKVYYVLGLIFECNDSDVLLKLYKSLVHPIVEYSNVIVPISYILDQQKLERIQHKANRIIPSLSGLLYNDRLRNLCLLSL